MRVPAMGAVAYGSIALGRVPFKNIGIFFSRRLVCGLKKTKNDCRQTEFDIFLRQVTAHDMVGTGEY